MTRNTENCRQMPEAKKDQGNHPLKLWESMTLLKTSVWGFSLQNCGTIYCCQLKSPGFVYFVTAAQETNTSSIHEVGIMVDSLEEGN